MENHNTVSFDAMVFVPEDKSDQLAPPRLVLPDDVQTSLFLDFREAAKNEVGFNLKVIVPGDDRRIGIVFNRIGRTIAYALLVYPEMDQIKHVHGLVALLSKVDVGEDRQAIDEVRKHNVIPQIN